MDNIEQILEKWLHAFKKYGHVVDVFENPSRKELTPIKDKYRFILDARRKKTYVWDAMGAVHGDTWAKLKKELGDERGLYRSGDLLSGTVDKKGLHVYAASQLSDRVRKEIKSQDWSFAKRYVDMDKLEDVLRKL